MAILKAKLYAIEAHDGQTYGEYPYGKHLNDVYNVLKLSGIYDELVLTVAFLHDTIEDTQIRYEDVFEDFGKAIADLTYLLTDKRGKTRKERHLATYPLIAEDARATTIKWADRLANILMSQHSRREQFFKYQKEHIYFKETLDKKFDIPEFDKAIEFIAGRIDAIIDEGPLLEI